MTKIKNTEINKLEEMGALAKDASYQLAKLKSLEKNIALTNIINAIKEDSQLILNANNEDLKDAIASKLNDAWLDRLTLDMKRLNMIISDIEVVIALDDPIGTMDTTRILDNNLRLTKCCVPLGVIGVIYEARPNVTVDIATLAIKTGNAAILRGGKETLRTNQALVNAIKKGLTASKITTDAVQFISSADRDLVTNLLQLDKYVDMIIPRGSATLQNFCKDNATIPVILGGIGICHIYVDKDADLKRSIALIMNAKTQRPTVCNALDTLLVHKDIASIFLKDMFFALNECKVELYGCDETQSLATKLGFTVNAATDTSFDTEWLGLILGIKIVDNIDVAIAHIRIHSTAHSDAILTDNIAASQKFVDEVDSSAVYVNASTRFTDGSEFGLGAEVAVSTQKMHARGPMGLNSLTTYKWVGFGDYLVRN